jgi:hypothetical protein
MKATIISPLLSDTKPLAICVVIPFETVEVSIALNNGVTSTNNDAKWLHKNDVRIFEKNTDKDLTVEVLGSESNHTFDGEDLTLIVNKVTQYEKSKVIKSTNDSEPEITEEVITQIRANYLGSDFAMILNDGSYKTEKLTIGTLPLFNRKDYLILNSLSKIVDKDAIEIAKFYGNEQLYVDNFDNLISHGKHIINCFLRGTARLDGTCYQYLTSKGYAMPYQNYSIEDLIKLNVYKIKEQCEVK